MAAPLGHKRYGGRKKGTPNKSTLGVAAICEARGCSPVDVLIDILQTSTNDDRRVKAALGLMEYIYVKRKAVDVDGALAMELGRKADEFSKLDKSEQIKLLRSAADRLENE